MGKTPLYTLRHIHMENRNMAQGSLGVLFNSIQGKAGSVVFAKTKDGTVIRPRVAGRNPKTAAQVAVRGNLGKAASAYKNMTPAQVTAWQTYAKTYTKHDSRTSKTYNSSAIAAFTSLSSKFLQVNPTGTIPLTPPTTAFGGDSIVVTATGGTGTVTFASAGTNAASVKTELLLQPLKSRNRTAQAKGYRSKGFAAFGNGVTSQAVTVPAGFYVPAYRFVNTLTGQEVGMAILPVVQVS